MSLVSWLATLGVLFVSTAVSAWGLSEFSKTVIVWAIGVPGGILLVIAAGFEMQSRIPGKQIDTEMRKARASVLAQGASFSQVDRLDWKTGLQKGVEVKVQLKNFGRTTAHDLMTSLSLGLRPSGNPGEFAIPAQASAASRAPLGPSEGAEITHELWVGPAEFSEFESGALSLYAWGSASYRDEFEGTRKTIFRYVASYNSQRRSWTFIPDRDGNKAE